MFVRGISLFLMAVIATTISGTMTKAEQRTPSAPQSEAGSSGLPILRKIPGLRILFGDDPAPADDADSRAGKGGDFDESYYEPQPASPQNPPKKTTVTPEKPASTSGGSSGSAGTYVPAVRAGAAEKPAATGLTCDKAVAVVSGYGFTDVAPASCAGKVYAFNAKRDGKSFAIKLDAASGELSEVKKLP